VEPVFCARRTGPDRNELICVVVIIGLDGRGRKLPPPRFSRRRGPHCTQPRQHRAVLDLEFRKGQQNAFEVGAIGVPLSAAITAGSIFGSTLQANLS